MELTFAPDGSLQIDNARIIWRNFEGRADRFNREGERNFTLVIPTQEIADALMNDVNEYGVPWNVRIKPPREEGDDPFMFLKVKVNFNGRGPHIYVVSGKARNKFTEENAVDLDEIAIANVSLDIRPSDKMVNGKPYRTAYLHSMEIIQEIDRFAARYAEEEYPEE